MLDILRVDLEARPYKKHIANVVGNRPTSFRLQMCVIFANWQSILWAFDRVDEHPEKYAKPFKTSIPEKTWSATKTVGELKSLAKKLGDHIANWVEQALEWAQRIFNGETWKAVCNDPDTEKWYRMVVWKNGDCRLVGGSVNCSDNIPVSGVYCISYRDDDIIYYAVPLVVSYEEDSPLLDRMVS